jgi:hypothetical protein
MRRTPPDQLPDWRLSFLLPYELPFLGLTEGHIAGLIGVKIGAHSYVEITGKNRPWVVSQAVKFIRRVAPGWVGELRIHFERDAEGPTISGPHQHRVRHTGSLIVNHRSESLMLGHSLRSLTEVA